MMTRVLAALMLSLSDSFLQIHIVLHQISKPQQHNNRWLRCWHKVQPLWIIGVLKLLRAQPSPAQPRDIEKQFQFWEMKDETRKVGAGSSVLCPVLLQHSDIQQPGPGNSGVVAMIVYPRQLLILS